MCTYCNSFHPVDTGSFDSAGVAVLTTAATGIAPNGLPIYSADEIATQLTTTYWGGQTWSYNLAATGGVLSFDVSALTSAGAALARTALASWSEVTGIVFREQVGSAKLTFDDEDAGRAYAGFGGYSGTIASSTINIARDWISNYGSTVGSYGYQTYLHEIGHALGLGHAGSYNGSASYPTNATYANDSWQASVMSYFSQQQNTYINGSYAYVVTPMAADILAMRSLYGPGQARTGDTVYGDGQTTGDAIYALTQGHALTIHDTGGSDLVNLASRSASQRLDLRAEAISDLDGRRGTFQIARGTVIENARTGSGQDTITGNDAANMIWSGAGADSVIGGDGNDNLWGEDGDDTLQGGLGDDSLRGGMGHDVLYGGDGNDAAYGYYGDDLIYGGAGNDTLWGDVGADRIWGEAGDDSLRGGSDNDFIDGGDGNDLIYGDAHDDTLAGGVGRDTLYGGSGNDQITGGDDDDLLMGEDGNDLLGGGTGNDTVYGGNGADTLNGFDGDDLLVGEAGNDSLVGGKGNDTMNGGMGADTFVGGQGNDLINGGGDADLVYGDTGNDTIYGGDGDDLILGGLDDDWMTGNQGNDILRGESGNDFVSGGMGDDWLYGDDGADVLYGDPGNDRLWGSRGNDTLSGGAGADVFIFATGDGADTIQDFDVFASGDLIDLRAVATIAGWDDLIGAHMLQSGADTLIDAGNGDSIRLIGVTFTDLAASDFLF